MQAKQPLILIHGMWSTPTIMDELKHDFENKGFAVLAPRLPLHYPKNELSDSDIQGIGRLSIQDYVDSLLTDIAKFMAEFPNQKPIIVGHSMGALLAQLVASRIATEKLIVISSAAPAGFNAWTWSVIRTFGHNLFKFPLWRQSTNLLLRNIQYGIANTQNSKVHKDLVQNATFESGLASMQISLWFMFPKRPTQVLFENIRCPVLIIGGSEDKITPYKLQEKISKKYGNKATLERIDGACHYTIGGSYFKEVTQRIESWLVQHKTLKQAA